MIIITIILNIAVGFSLGILYSMQRLKKVMNKTRKILEETEAENTITSGERLNYISGRLDVAGELLGQSK